MSITTKKVISLVDSFAETLHMKVGLEISQPVPLAVCIGVLLFSVSVSLDTSQLMFAFFGAIMYAALQALQVRPKGLGTKAPPSPAKKVTADYNCGLYRSPNGGNTRPASRGRAAFQPRGNSRIQSSPTKSEPPTTRVEVRKPSSQPVSAPVFQGKGWDAEVDELLAQIMPTPEGQSIVKAVADFVEQRIKPLVPEVEVVAFASGDLVRGTAFGVAVPEVDIVVSVSPHILAQRLQGRFSKGNVSSMRLDVRKLQKSAIRACTDLLVSPGGFKFRRSAFRGEEPKVTLLVPASFGVWDESIPIDFTVNSTTPLYNMALLTECGKKEARARALILLVKRWAKDRGVCHAAKGHLSPYPWSLLVIFFLQVGEASENGGPLLPPVEEFEASSSLMAGTSKLPQAKDFFKKAPSAPRSPAPKDIAGPLKSVGDLFKDFINFYHREFDWRKEAICVRKGKRGPPGLSLPLHIIMHDETQLTEVGPSIEDPFDPARNLGVVMTAASLARLHQEIARADELCANYRSLTDLLEPWAPPERASLHDEDHDMAEKEEDGH